MINDKINGFVFRRIQGASRAHLWGIMQTSKAHPWRIRGASAAHPCERIWRASGAHPNFSQCKVLMQMVDDMRCCSVTKCVIVGFAEHCEKFGCAPDARQMRSQGAPQMCHGCALDVCMMRLGCLHDAPQMRLGCALDAPENKNIDLIIYHA